MSSASRSTSDPVVRIVNDRDGAAFDCEPPDTVLRAALRAGIGMAYSCNTGSCGNCRFELLEGEVRHLRDDPPAWGPKDAKRNRWLGCQAAPEGDLRVRFRAMEDYVPPVRPARRSARLVSVAPLTRDISDFAFEVGGADGFRPGQYALFHVPGVDGARGYSMANLPGEGVWRFLIKRAPDGAATARLFAASPGDEIEIDGPYGTAYLREDGGRDLLLLAGGSGLSPMVSIAKAAVAAGLHRDRAVRLFYGGREEADLVGPEVLEEAAPHVAFTAVLSEPGAGWNGPRGFVHEAAFAALGDRAAESDLYFAGPPAMAAAVQAAALDAGVAPERMRFDEFY